MYLFALIDFHEIVSHWVCLFHEDLEVDGSRVFCDISRFCAVFLDMKSIFSFSGGQPISLSILVL